MKMARCGQRRQTLSNILPILVSVILGAAQYQSAGQSSAGAVGVRGVIDPQIVAASSAGSNPSGSLLQASDGTFYGTCGFEFQGGNCGTVFHMNSAGGLVTLATFYGDNGMTPHGALVFGNDGNLYGTALYGANGYNGDAFTGDGTIFMVTPKGTSSTLTTLWSFTGGSDGANPSGVLFLGPGGNFYGTTSQGGAYNDGVIYMLTPNGTSSTMKTLWTFSGAADGASPNSLVPATGGIYYGTTSSNGPSGFGTIFRLDLTGTGSTLKTIASFNGFNGAGPEGLTLGPNGNYYGVTSGGGKYGFGTAFEVTPAGQLTTLATFNGVNGGEPSGFLLATNGYFYGTTGVGGAANGGTFFQMSSRGVLTTRHDFDPLTGAIWDVFGIIEGMDHSFYGADSNGGAVKGGGAVFALIPSGSAFRVIDLLDFTPGLIVPSCVAVRATNVTEHEATLIGIVNPNTVYTTVQFELSADGHSAAGHLVNATYTNSEGVGSGTKGEIVKATYTGLAESTTYYFQIDSTNGPASRYSEGPSFSTPGRPTISYNAPTAVTAEGATLGGEVNPRGHVSVAYFQYGASYLYGKSSPKINIGSGYAAVPISFALKGLAANTEYHYRIVAVSALGEALGPDHVLVTGK